jgi:hypothetical protein
MSDPSTPDPTDTARCPRGHRCESCGTAGRGLVVVSRQVLAETLCLTLCLSCAASGRPPAIMLSTAERLVEQHRRHLQGSGR